MHDDFGRDFLVFLLIITGVFLMAAGVVGLVQAMP